jgi:8-oxo-dGTP pyrophosphatase MutT (NUDIX family)
LVKTADARRLSDTFVSRLASVGAAMLDHIENGQDHHKGDQRNENHGRNRPKGCKSQVLYLAERDHPCKLRTVAGDRMRLSARLVTAVMRVWWRLRRPMTLGARIAAFNDSGEVMLVRHSYTPGWHLPGGGVERGESMAEAALKELREEAGLAPAPGSAPALFGVYMNPGFRGDHIAVFVLRGVVPVPSDSQGEIVERGFFSLAALPEGTTRATLERLAELAPGGPEARRDW